ncbi:MAG: ADP-ribosylglycohydrolase family protein [Lentisphaerae bacterium]|jgi:ADP-ribosylglycohydrolase|nr:ADP-ribosylglycohydrolase family protein [Lentisphaerota bacterium]
MQSIPNYEQQVYAAVLGKVIGVYMGRPFEGWSKAKIEETWGRIDRYVNEDRQVPLVVSDDDISGTFTFIRALEDSGLYEQTPPAFFGETWLNYLLEGRCILWWGGLGVSTEHTAFLRLKQGIPSPRSGAISTNGQVVAEQIGAQIFIDAFGMVAPGKPELAAKLARRAAAVSHDGEALNAAVVVAGMIAAAFVEKDMAKLLDIGVAQIPAESLIAQVHLDVRQWCREDGDWRQTFTRINERYGYHRYGGNCHVIPNHAIMVMAWAYAGNDFHEAQAIINTAGWDTDCNAGNVGALMGLVVGLDRICEKYDFISPMGGRIILPTAEGTRASTDCLSEASAIARIGRQVMRWPQLPAPKGGAWLHFSQPLAQQGFLSDEQSQDSRGALRLSNPDGEALNAHYSVNPGRVARMALPVYPGTSSGGGYQTVGVSKLYSGMTVHADVACPTPSTAQMRLFITVAATEAQAPPCVIHGPAQPCDGKPRTLEISIPDTALRPVTQLGLEIRSQSPTTGLVRCLAVRFGGTARLNAGTLPVVNRLNVPGWVVDADVIRGAFSDDREAVQHFGKNSGRGLAVTGNRFWRDQSIQARVKVHLADEGGLIARYQGLNRFIALVRRQGHLVIYKRFYGDQILAEMPCDWPLDQVRELRLHCVGNAITAYFDGQPVLQATDDDLRDGAVGLIFSNGLVGFRDIAIESSTQA